MPDAPEGPRLYLITPPQFDPELPDVLASLLDAFDIACLRLTLPGASEDDVARAADALRPVAHARDVPLVVTGHIGLVTRLGLDGVHLADGSAQVRAARKALGPDAIVGAYRRRLAPRRHDRGRARRRLRELRPRRQPPSAPPASPTPRPQPPSTSSSGGPR